MGVVDQGMQSGPVRLFAEQMEPLGKTIRLAISRLIALDADAARAAAADASQTPVRIQRRALRDDRHHDARRIPGDSRGDL